MSQKQPPAHEVIVDKIGEIIADFCEKSDRFKEVMGYDHEKKIASTKKMLAEASGDLGEIFAEVLEKKDLEDFYHTSDLQKFLDMFHSMEILVEILHKMHIPEKEKLTVAEKLIAFKKSIPAEAEAVKQSQIFPPEEEIRKMFC